MSLQYQLYDDLFVNRETNGETAICKQDAFCVHLDGAGRFPTIGSILTLDPKRGT